jgi:oxygen-independent coproporphyrinogen-3 oxidase
MLIPTPINGNLSLYFHLPFCEKKCDYCHFFVLPNKDSFKEALLKGLLIEIDLRASELSSSNIQSIYFGGGTPALMGASSIQLILDRVQKYTSIKNIEITLEFNPENQNLDLFKSYFDVGINRISLGVQSLEDSLLKKLGRTHLAKDSKLALENANAVGFHNISIDLMYDLPTQTLEDWQRTIAQAIHFPIQHISLYNLSIEKETVFYKKRATLQKMMPSSELSLQMFQEASAIFEKNGFHSYEISAFSKPGYFSQHNVGYWLQRPHLGFGPSAFSLLGSHRFQNVINLRKYCSFLDQNKLPIDFEETLEPEAFLRESLILNLRLNQGLDLILFQKRFGLLSSELLQTLKDLEEKNWIHLKSNHLSLTEEGRLFHDTLASQLVF